MYRGCSYRTGRPTIEMADLIPVTRWYASLSMKGDVPE